MNKLVIIGVVVLSLGTFGCSGGSGADVSKQAEQDFRNPPKEIPPASLKARQEARAKGAKISAEMRAKAAAGGGPPAPPSTNQ